MWQALLWLQMGRAVSCMAGVLPWCSIVFHGGYEQVAGVHKSRLGTWWDPRAVGIGVYVSAGFESIS